MKQRRNEQMKERTNKERNKRKKGVMNEPTGGPENQRKVRVRQPLSQSD